VLIRQILFDRMLASLPQGGAALDEGEGDPGGLEGRLLDGAGSLAVGTVQECSGGSQSPDPAASASAKACTTHNRLGGKTRRQARGRPGRITDVGTAFVPGLQLAREFYAIVVRPLLEERFPGVPYAAALLGPGSEVGGFDSQRSTDHDWGPRLQVFLPDGDAARQAPDITAMLASRLPADFRSYPDSLTF
jgi:hypothetical protein